MKIHWKKYQILEKKLDQGANENTQSRSLTKVRFNIGNQAVFTNPDGESVTGNSSKKTALFSGAGGGAAPVIRGILMTPQGVKAAINLAIGKPVSFLYDILKNTLPPQDPRQVELNKLYDVKDGTIQSGLMKGYLF